jgi:hypothetical protein
MFGLFKKKPDFDVEKMVQFVNAISDMLELQRIPAVNSSIEDCEGRLNRKAIGYVYGFIDAALGSIGQRMSDASIGMPITYHVLKRLFPGHEDDYTKFLYDQVGKDEIVMLGVIKGGQQYIEYLKSGRKGVPMGFGMFLLEGDNH